MVCADATEAEALVARGAGLPKGVRCEIAIVSVILFDVDVVVCGELFEGEFAGDCLISCCGELQAMEDEATGVVDKDSPACVALLFAPVRRVKTTVD